MQCGQHKLHDATTCVGFSQLGTTHVTLYLGLICELFIFVRIVTILNRASDYGKRKFLTLLVSTVNLSVIYQHDLSK